MAVNKVVYDGKTLIDLSGDSVTPETLAEGVTAHAASGERIVGTLGAETIPGYWKTELDEGVKAINIALCDAGYNKAAFLYYTDVHWNYGSKRAPSLLKYLYQHTGINKTFFGGDIVNDEADDYETMSYIWDWRNQLKDLPNHHSVTGNHDDGNTTNNLFDVKHVYGFLLAAEETPDIVRGKDGLYYYIDSPTEKTRYLFLDTAFQSVYYSDSQKEFVDNALLTTPDGWHIVAIAHIWHDTDYSVNPPVPIGHSPGGAYLLGRFDAYNSRDGEFADCGAWVEFCIGGHTHWDFDSTSEGGIPVLLMETDSKHVRSGLGYTVGTTTENSVNGIIADYDAKKIKVVRIGRGSSREVEMTWYEVSYTNVLDTVGYVENKYVSASSGYAEKDRDGVDLTGYIPVKHGDIIRLKNVTMPDVNDYSNNVYFFNSSKVGTASASITSTEEHGFNPVYKGGNLVQFTVLGKHMGWDGGAESAVTGFIRIGAANIDSSCIITVNELIPSDGSSVSYTNLIPTAVDADGVTIYNGKGYKENTRINSSGEETTATGWYLTGYIPVKKYDIVRFANMEYLDISGDGGEYSRAGFHLYDADFEYFASASHSPTALPNESIHPVFNEKGDLIQFSVPNWDVEVAYIRICCGYLDATSIITVNEEINTGVQPPEQNEGYNNILKEVGYTENTRLSVSGGYTETTASGVDLTGYIPAKSGDVLRFENIVIPETGEDNSHMLYLFGADKTGFAALTIPQWAAKSNWDAVWENGYLKQLTLGTSVDGTISFVRITGIQIDDTSIISVNQEITDGGVSYTNLLPTAVDVDGVTIYNGKGYKENIRISDTTGEFKANTGSYCTGFIKIPNPTAGAVVTVRLKNITCNTANNYGCHIKFFAQLGTVPAATVNLDSSYLEQYYHPVYDADGNITEIRFTQPDTPYQYIAMSAVKIDDTSIITINEPIE